MYELDKKSKGDKPTAGHFFWESLLSTTKLPGVRTCVAKSLLPSWEKVPEGRMRGIEGLLSTRVPSIDSPGNKKEPLPVLFWVPEGGRTLNIFIHSEVLCH